MALKNDGLNGPLGPGFRDTTRTLGVSIAKKTLAIVDQKLARSTDVTIGLQTIGCDGLPIINQLNGGACANDPTSGTWVLVNRIHGVPGLLTKGLTSRPFKSISGPPSISTVPLAAPKPQAPAGNLKIADLDVSKLEWTSPVRYKTVELFPAAQWSTTSTLTGTVENWDPAAVNDGNISKRAGTIAGGGTGSAGVILDVSSTPRVFCAARLSFPAALEYMPGWDINNKGLGKSQNGSSEVSVSYWDGAAWQRAGGSSQDIGQNVERVVSPIQWKPFDAGTYPYAPFAGYHFEAYHLKSSGLLIQWDPTGIAPATKWRVLWTAYNPATSEQVVEFSEVQFLELDGYDDTVSEFKVYAGMAGVSGGASKLLATIPATPGTTAYSYTAFDFRAGPLRTVNVPPGPPYPPNRTAPVRRSGYPGTPLTGITTNGWWLYEASIQSFGPAPLKAPGPTAYYIDWLGAVSS